MAAVPPELPEPLWADILDRLRGPARGAAACVCRQWHAMLLRAPAQRTLPHFAAAPGGHAGQWAAARAAGVLPAAALVLVQDDMPPVAAVRRARALLPPGCAVVGVEGAIVLGTAGTAPALLQLIPQLPGVRVVARMLRTAGDVKAFGAELADADPAQTACIVLGGRECVDALLGTTAAATALLHRLGIRFAGGLSTDRVHEATEAGKVSSSRKHTVVLAWIVPRDASLARPLRWATALCPRGTPVGAGLAASELLAQTPAPAWVGMFSCCSRLGQYETEYADLRRTLPRAPFVAFYGLGELVAPDPNARAKDAGPTGLRYHSCSFLALQPVRPQ